MMSRSDTLLAVTERVTPSVTLGVTSRDIRRDSGCYIRDIGRDISRDSVTLRRDILARARLSFGKDVTLSQEQRDVTSHVTSNVTGDVTDTVTVTVGLRPTVTITVSAAVDRLQSGKGGAV